MSGAGEASGGFAIGLVFGFASVWLAYKFVVRPRILVELERAVPKAIAETPEIPAGLRPLLTTLAVSVALDTAQNALP